jgi:hypothetical protein
VVKVHGPLHSGSQWVLGGCSIRLGRQGKAAHLRHPPTRIVESNADIEGVHFFEWTRRKQDLLECGGVDISDHVEDRRFQNRNSRDVPEYPGRLDWLTIMYIRQTGRLQPG